MTFRAWNLETGGSEFTIWSDAAQQKAAMQRNLTSNETTQFDTILCMALLKPKARWCCTPAARQVDISSAQHGSGHVSDAGPHLLFAGLASWAMI